YYSKGPSYIWHMDSCDKLKPCGICVNGYIDGFSRQIIWFEACNTCNNPKVIASYYMDAVEELDGCPRRFRADMETENMYVEHMQTFLR
ncbi:hypothetical protein LSAT2_027919, partial [Lamellibrachia satsuma]